MAELAIFPDGGKLPDTVRELAEQINADLLAFFESVATAASH